MKDVPLLSGHETIGISRCQQGRTSYLVGLRLHTFHGPLAAFLPSLLLEADPLNTARGLREHCELPQWGSGRAEPQQKSNLVHFGLKSDI